MMKLDTKHAFLKEDIAGYQDIVTKCHEDLHNKTGKGNDYVGWVEWPNNYDKEEYARLKSVAARETTMSAGWNGQTIMTRKVQG